MYPFDVLRSLVVFLVGFVLGGYVITSWSESSVFVSPSSTQVYSVFLSPPIEVSPFLSSVISYVVWLIPFRPRIRDVSDPKVLTAYLTEGSSNALSGYPHFAFIQLPMAFATIRHDRTMYAEWL